MPHGESRVVILLVGQKRGRQRFLNWLAKHKEIDTSEINSSSYMDEFSIAVLDDVPLSAQKLPVQSAVNFLKSLEIEE